MATDVIKLDYEMAAEMSATFRSSAQQMEQTMQAVQTLANTLEEGALLGRAGKDFVDAIRSKLTPSISKLIQKYQELDKDVQDAVNFMKEADKTSAGLMK